MSELPAVQHASNSCDSAVLFCGTESYLYIVAEALREVAVSLLCFLLLKGFLTPPKGLVSFSPKAQACSATLKVTPFVQAAFEINPLPGVRAGSESVCL